MSNITHNFTIIKKSIPLCHSRSIMKSSSLQLAGPLQPRFLVGSWMDITEWVLINIKRRLVETSAQNFPSSDTRTSLEISW
jgi:hypothetical protein